MTPTFDENISYEQSIRQLFDAIYKEKGWEVVNRNHKKGHDLTLRIDGREYKVEEKARRRVWSDLLIETIQDTETKAPGWIRYCDADLLIYGMFGREGSRVYLLPVDKFRAWFEMMESGLQEQESKDGWGNTINLKVPIYSIPNELIREIHRGKNQ